MSTAVYTQPSPWTNHPVAGYGGVVASPTGVCQLWDKFTCPVMASSLASGVQSSCIEEVCSIDHSVVIM